MAKPEKNIIRIPDPDVPIYRMVRLPHFWDMIRSRELVLVQPERWEDPLEDFPRRCGIVYDSTPGRRHEYLGNMIDPIYAQCWSTIGGSDLLWRAYSRVDKDGGIKNTCRDQEAVQVQTTARKLLRALWDWSPRDRTISCFIGAVSYMSQEEVERHIGDLAGKYAGAICSGAERAELVLFKRSHFSYEAEIRLIYTYDRQQGPIPDLVRVPVGLHKLVDKVVFDPRLEYFEVKDREAEARGLGYSGDFGECKLYEELSWIITR